MPKRNLIIILIVMVFILRSGLFSSHPTFRSFHKDFKTIDCHHALSKIIFLSSLGIVCTIARDRFTGGFSLSYITSIHFWK